MINKITSVQSIVNIPMEWSSSSSSSQLRSYYNTLTIILSPFVGVYNIVFCGKVYRVFDNEQYSLRVIIRMYIGGRLSRGTYAMYNQIPAVNHTGSIYRSVYIIVICLLTDILSN